MSLVVPTTPTCHWSETRPLKSAASISCFVRKDSVRCFSLMRRLGCARARKVDENYHTVNRRHGDLPCWFHKGYGRQMKWRFRDSEVPSEKEKGTKLNLHPFFEHRRLFCLLPAHAWSWLTQCTWRCRTVPTHALTRETSSYLVCRRPSCIPEITMSETLPKRADHLNGEVLCVLLGLIPWWMPLPPPASFPEIS